MHDPKTAKSYQISPEMDIETMPHAMYFSGNKETMTKINQVPYQVINYDDKVQRAIMQRAFSSSYAGCSLPCLLVPALFGSRLHLLSEGCALVWGMVVRGCARRDLC